MRTPSPKYTAEFKQKAVELYKKSGGVDRVENVGVSRKI